MNGLRDKRFYLYLLYAKMAVLVLFIFSPPVLPHLLRQVDTMAITLRYWLRWSLETSPRYPLIPAYLAEGDSYAIQFTEFPILNLLMAPLFRVGVEYGRVLCNLFLISLNLGLTFGAYRSWKGKSVGGVDAGDAFFVLPFLAASGTYFYKHIPDYTAFILITWAVGVSFDEKRRNFAMSFFLCALGVLIKPAQVIALAPLLLYPNRKFIAESILKWIFPAAVPCGLYYTVVKDEILKLADAALHFGTHIRNPVESLIRFFSHPGKLISFVNEAFFGKFVILPVLSFCLYSVWKTKKISPLVLILGLQTLGLALLDGDHLFVHRYYLCGFGFVAALAFTRFTSLAPRWVVLLAMVILSVDNFERLFYDVRPVFKDNIYKQCRELKASTPELPWNRNYSFRSGYREDPSLGLCFGEREGSFRSEYGFIYKIDRLPDTCEKLLESKDIVLVKCSNDSEYREVLRFY